MMHSATTRHPSLSRAMILLLSVFLLPLSACRKTEPSDQKVFIVEIKTSYGDMLMWLYTQTPKHRENFMKLASEGFYDSTTFHRIIADFVIQGGDPNSKDGDSTNDGTGGPGYMIPAEFVDSITHVFGAVGAARNNNPQKESNGSQFYIVVNKNGQHSLDMNYTVFGIIFHGMDVATTIMKQPKNSVNRPYDDIIMDVNVVEKTVQELKTKYDFKLSF